MFKLVVLSAALAVASASPSGLLGLGGLISPWNAAIAAPLAAPIASPLALSLAAPLAAAPLAALAPIGAPNYRGPLSLAPGQPANILGADGRPLDTLSVNLDRAAHLTAKAIEGSGHLLKKRSIGAPLALAAPLAAGPLVASSLAASPLIASPLAASPLIASPLAAARLAASPLAAANLAAAQLAGAGVIAGPGLALSAPGLALSAPGLALSAPGLALPAPGLALSAPLGIASPLGLGQVLLK
ncbi:cuticle protein 16.5-like [Bicyclus anynana]|uniref:Cuticle protein 16.5-like n=1 Tax=Bicyclus anynana TaxID=110368 RepID=A0ABM3LRK3_BICAN|nr:cuticle protein 16.5-like [Bicyclus anynana]